MICLQTQGEGYMSARAILELRQQKYYTCFAQAELRHVFQTKKLTNPEKMLWVALANETMGNVELKVKKTLAQIGTLVNRGARRVQQIIVALKQKGYLNADPTIDENILIYQLVLPETALAEIRQAPNRSGAAKTDTNFFAPTPERNFAPPTKEISTLYNKDNNKNKHMSATHKCEEETSCHSVLDTESQQLREGQEQNPELKQKYETLIAKHHHLLHEVYKSIPIMQRLAKVRAEFTDEERKLMECYQQSVDATCHPALDAGSHSHRDPGYFSAKNPGVMSSVQIQCQGETFIVEPEVKKLIYTQIPKFVAMSQFKGRAAMLSTTALQHEALFYITKAGTRKGAIINQRHRFFTFCQLCIQGVWEQPKGMLNREITQREQLWELQKSEEKRYKIYRLSQNNAQLS